MSTLKMSTVSLSARQRLSLACIARGIFVQFIRQGVLLSMRRTWNRSQGSSLNPDQSVMRGVLHLARSHIDGARTGQVEIDSFVYGKRRHRETVTDLTVDSGWHLIANRAQWDRQRQLYQHSLRHGANWRVHTRNGIAATRSSHAQGQSNEDKLGPQDVGHLASHPTSLPGDAGATMQFNVTVAVTRPLPLPAYSSNSKILKVSPPILRLISHLKHRPLHSSQTIP